MKAAIELTAIPLARAAPVADDVNLKLEGGTLTAAGTFEAVSGRQHARLRTATIDGLKVDYIHAPRLEQSQRAEKVAKATADLAAQPGLQVDVEELHLVNTTVGVVDTTTKPNYRVFVDQGDMRVLNVSNQPSQGRGWLTLKGRFMGSGQTDAVDLIRLRSARRGRERGHPDPRHRHDEDERSLPRPGRLRRRRRSLLVLLRAVPEPRQDRRLRETDFRRRRTCTTPGRSAARVLGQHVYEGVVGGIAGLLENRNEPPRRARASRVARTRPT